MSTFLPLEFLMVGVLRSWFAMLVAVAFGAAMLGLAPAQAVPPAGTELVGWGLDNEGQATAPAELSGVPVIAAAAGGYHSLALTADGQVVAWGYDGFGVATVPGSLSGKTVVAISAAATHNLALTSDGEVIVWGSNFYGEGTMPESVSSATITAIAAGDGHNLAVTDTGEVIAWGRDNLGQATVPAGLTGKTVTAVAAGSAHSLALTSDGEVFAWGWDGQGRATVPAGLAGVTAIAAGQDHSLALTSFGEVVAWGSDGDGQVTVPESLSGVTAIAAGYNFSVALTDAGQIVGWGSDDSGQVTVPEAYSGGTFTGVFAGYFSENTLAIYAPAAGTAPTVGAVRIAGLARPGRTVSVSAPAVTGDPAPSLSYQWQSKSGGAWADVDGATASTLTIPGVLGGTKLRVQVTATNTAGSDTSTSRVRKVGQSVAVTKSTKPAGAGCTRRGTVGNDALTVSAAANKTTVVCLYRGADTVTINSIGNNARVVLSKGAGSLEVVWNAGGRKHGDTVGVGALTIVRPVGTTITASQGDSPNVDLDGATAVCLTNGAYAQAGSLTALEDAITGAIDWFNDETSEWVENSC